MVRLTAILVIVGVLGGWGFLTHRETYRFTSELALWAQAVEQSPLKPRPALNYGRALDQAGLTSEAAVWYQRALNLVADRSPRERGIIEQAVLANRGHLALLHGDVLAALTILESGLQQYPEYFPLRFNRAVALTRAQRCADADQAWTQIGVPQHQRPPC